jgi:hypothetical protein
MRIMLVGKKMVWSPDAGRNFVRNEPVEVKDEVAMSLMAQNTKDRAMFEIVKEKKGVEKK